MSLKRRAIANIINQIDEAPASRIQLGLDCRRREVVKVKVMLSKWASDFLNQLVLGMLEKRGSQAGVSDLSPMTTIGEG